MSDDSALSGWLFADLALVIALVFLAVAPGIPLPTQGSAMTPTPTPTFAPSPIPSPTSPTDCTPRTDFRFDQLVVTDVTTSSVTWERIAAARVRVELTKATEDAQPLAESDFLPHTTAGEYLTTQQASGSRIALIETFGWVPAGTLNTKLAQEVNEELIEGILAEQLPGLTAQIFLRPEDASAEWAGSYLDSGIQANSARINVFFAQALPPDCDPD